MDVSVAAGVFSLMGAVIGGGITAGSAVLIDLFRRRQEHHHKVLEQALSLGLAEFKHDIELAKLSRYPESRVPPPAAYAIYYQLLLLKMAEGQVTAADIQEITRNRDDILSVFPGG